MTQQEILEVIVKALDSKRAEDIQVLRVQDLTILGDYFIIANGTSTTHTRTLADEVEYQMSEKGVEPMHREGRGNGSNWVVLDYADVIVFEGGVQLKLPVVEEAETSETVPPWRATA